MTAHSHRELGPARQQRLAGCLAGLAEAVSPPRLQREGRLVRTIGMKLEVEGCDGAIGDSIATSGVIPASSRAVIPAAFHVIISAAFRVVIPAAFRIVVTTTFLAVIPAKAGIQCLWPRSPTFRIR
mgnify:CR=1 FL=1